MYILPSETLEPVVGLTVVGDVDDGTIDDILAGFDDGETDGSLLGFIVGNVVVGFDVGIGIG